MPQWRAAADGIRAMVASAIVVAGCAEPAVTPCPPIDCPSDKVCDGRGGCAFPEQLSSCEGKPDGEPCAYPEVASASCQGGLCVPLGCGNQIITADEVCDDGNTVNGDGCSADCRSDETCGNAIVDPTGGEQCDDGNHASGDGCQDGCLLPRCGDGVVDAAVVGEVCDDGNTVSGDACSADCRSNETCGNEVVDYVIGEQCDSGITGLSRDGCTSRCTSEVDWWLDVSPALPPARTSHAMAYDENRQRVVVFGGGSLGDTLEWDGVVWRRLRPVPSPSARTGHAMAYDAQRRRVILFGGSNSLNSAMDDTWEWDGLFWTKRSPATSPSPRSGHAMAYDRQRQETVVFGGPGLADTWAWDGTTWSQRVTTIAPPKGGGEMAYDAQAGKLVLYPTVLPSASLSETWTWDGSAWTKLAGTSPPRRQATAMVATSAGLLLYGGSDNGAQERDTWRWSSGAWTQLAPATDPGLRSGHAMAYDVARDRVVVFAGQAPYPQPTYNDTWEWTGTTWVSMNPQLGQPRYDAAGAYQPLAGKVITFGGVGARETWEWDGVAWVLRAPLTSPEYRFYHAAVATRDRVVMFGGLSFLLNPIVTDETWEWDGNDWTQKTPATLPPRRFGHVLAYDSRRDRVILFGGTDFNAAMGDTWEWDGSDWMLRTPASAPDPGEYAAMVYDPVRAKTALFGDPSGVWELDGEAWQRIDTPVGSPAVRAAAFDPMRGRIVATAPDSTGTALDTWEWDGTTWTRLDPEIAPPATSGGWLVYDAARGQLGGVTWTHRWTSAAVPADRCIDVDTDGDGLAGCADPDCWGRCTPLCPPGVTCDPASPRCGDGSCSDLEDYRLCAADCAPP